MYSIEIASRLWFEETLLGATLHYRSSDAPDAVLFKVGISFDSLLACNSSMGTKACMWTIRDGSLTVLGDREQLTLTFCAVNGDLIQKECMLFGEELKAFRYAVNALAHRQLAQLN